MRYILSFLFILVMNGLQAQQFRYDNVQFKTVYPEDLCDMLGKHPGALLLDVRTRGEHYDTSGNSGLNLGHLKDARNIPLGELAQRWREVDAYKNEPVFVYCSHSQRSRRASHLLADSGFTNIYNINGGMTQLLKMRSSLPGCFNVLYKTNNKYTIVSATELAEGAKKKNAWLIIDLRSDSVYNRISLQEKKNAMGRLQPSVNIPLSELKNNLAKIPRNKHLLLVDEYGNESPLAAGLLDSLGYKNVSVLLYGMDGWMNYNINEKQLSNTFGWTGPQKYTLLSAGELKRQINVRKVVLIDVRPAEQFENRSKNYWENIGHIKDAVNIPFDQINGYADKQLTNKSEYIVLYTFNDQPEVYETAAQLARKGYNNVHILYGGIWNIRWASHNLKGKADLAGWVVDVPAENL